MAYGFSPTKGNHELSATMPPTGMLRSVCRATAPPCENPPTTMRSLGIPFDTSCSTMSWTIRTLSMRPCLSSTKFSPRSARSNQPGMDIPWLIVIGRFGAVGKTYRTHGICNCALMDAHPWPLSPSPCNQTTLAVCVFLGSTTTGSGYAMAARVRVCSLFDTHLRLHWTLPHLPSDVRMPKPSAALLAKSRWMRTVASSNRRFARPGGCKHPRMATVEESSRMGTPPSGRCMEKHDLLGHETVGKRWTPS
mmetsp:Transcript_6671/g.23553  ORF Transcript_6671/g.23553 Transcript_6671/m.23553 type:complete len:250 (+) Transcript_6671:1529-2278(+)